MRKRGFNSTYLVLFSIMFIILISGFVGATCGGTLSCSLINGYPEEERSTICSKIYGAWCSFSISTATCSNKAGVSCTSTTPSMTEDKCDGTVGCTWCDPQEYYECYNGDVWWFDCNDNPTSMRTDCSSSQICQINACVAASSGSCSGTLRCNLLGGSTTRLNNLCAGIYGTWCYVSSWSSLTCSNRAGVSCTSPMMPSSLCDGTAGCVVCPSPRVVCNGVCCPSGQNCYNNACTLACTDDAGCTSAGTSCEGTSRKTCTLGGDGCLDKTLSACPSYPNANPTCSGAGVCSASCTSSYKYCDGSATDGNGCECPISGYHCSGSSCVQDCIPNANIACSGGDVWIYDSCWGNGRVYDDCTNGEVCDEGSFECECTPTKTSCSALDCGQVSNGCYGEYISCPPGCTGGKECILNTCTCISNDYTACSDNDVYNFNSCGVREDKNEECSDGNPCTVDICSSGSCSHTPYVCSMTSDGCCNSPTCNIGNDVDCTTCTIPSQCNDNNNACTNNVCLGGTCTYPSITCNDDKDCTIDSCNPSSGCVYTPKSTGTSCATDNNACTNDVCSSSGTCLNNPITCNDNFPCTTDSCSISSGCVYSPITSCRDNDNCCPSGYGCTIANDNNCIPGCGDGTCNSGAGETCSTCETDCPCLDGKVCQSGECVPPPTLCGNGNINSGEDCDGSNLGGETCESVLGSEYAGILSCSSCSFNTSGCFLACDLTSAYWSTTSALAGNSVRLNINGTNCGGKTISFVVMEKDTLFDDTVNTNPSPIVYSSQNAYGTWKVEWQDDSGGFEINPPEYYFTAIVEGTSESITSSKADEDMLKVYENANVVCAGVDYCSNYRTESNCQADLCRVGKNSVPSLVTCGGVFNPETGCYDYTDCGCTWDSASGTCEADWEFESSCEVCGNHVRDFGEECDDGNLISGDRCSSSCEFEETYSPCSEGLTLCSDGTCSLNCYYTDISVAECDYDNSCDGDEGCTCIDCDGEQDACEEGLICTIFNTACCTSESDGECNPYCSYVDPDCSPGICGNGFREVGEECDLGIRNGQTDSGCSASCTLQIIYNINGCPEGTTLCSDDTCSLNCYETDEGVADCNNDGWCDVGEGCTCSDCDGLQDTCKAGLICSLVDQACCKENEDGFCNQYCAFIDPDCAPQEAGEGIFSIGTCLYSENSQDTCEDDGMLTRSLSADWIWDPENVLMSDPLGKRNNCAYIEDTFACPASVEVPFFGIYQLVIAIGIVGLIYILYILSKKNHSKPVRKKRKK